MQIILNGETQEIEQDLTIKGLLAKLEISGPAAVELNLEVCPKARHQETIIKQGDRIEIVTIVGGG